MEVYARRVSRSRSLQLLILTLVVALGLRATSGALPGPVTVERSADDGALRLRPVAAAVDAAPRDRVPLDLTLANGGSVTATFEFEVVPVQADASGAPQPATDDDALPSAAAWIELPTRQVRLASSETAQLPLAVSVPPARDPGGYVAMVTAVSTDTVPEVRVSSVVIVRVGSAPTLAADLDVITAGRSGELRLRLDSQEGGVVDGVRLALRSWASTDAVDRTLGPLAVLPGVPRLVRQPFSLPRLPGGYRADAAVSFEGTTQRATAEAWLWHRGLLLVIAVLLLAVTVVALVANRRRSRPEYSAAIDDRGRLR